MRILTAITAIISLLCTQALANDANYNKRLELATEIVKISQAEQLAEQMSNALVAQQIQALRATPALGALTDAQFAEIAQGLTVIVSEELSPYLPELVEQMTPSFAEVYTLEELEGLLKFYKSPTGRAMVAKQSALMNSVMAISAQWSQNNMAALSASMQPRIIKLIEGVMAQ